MKVKLKYKDLDFNEDLIIISSTSINKRIAFKTIFGIENIHEKEEFKSNPIVSKANIYFSTCYFYRNMIGITRGEKETIHFDSKWESRNSIILKSKDVVLEKEYFSSNIKEDSYKVEQNIAKKIQEFIGNTEKFKFKLIYSLSDGISVYINESLEKRIASVKYSSNKMNVYIKLDTGVNFCLPIHSEASVCNLSIESPKRTKNDKTYDSEPVYFDEEAYYGNYLEKFGLRNFRNVLFEKILLKRMSVKEQYTLAARIYKDISEGKYIKLCNSYFKKSEIFNLINYISLVPPVRKKEKSQFIGLYRKNNDKITEIIQLSRGTFKQFIKEIEKINDAEYKTWKENILNNCPVEGVEW